MSRLNMKKLNLIIFINIIIDFETICLYNRGKGGLDFMDKKLILGVFVVICATAIGLHIGMNDQNFIKVETSSQQVLTDESVTLENSIESGEMIAKDNTIENSLTPIGKQKEKYIPESVKAVYATGWVMGTPSLRKSMIESLKENGFNAIVIDIKDEAGQLTYDSKVQTAVDIKASKTMVRDIVSVINELKENDIFVIGRIVTFKDPIYALKVDSAAYKMEDGSTWKDYGGRSWPNPYNEESWEYPIALAKEAAELGFQEIQFDYIRFPSSEGKVKNIAFGFDSATKSKADVICGFLEKVMEELSGYNIPVSADVFGITTKRDGDFENIGQDFARIANIVDIVCPMVYPSHYANNEYKIARPDKNPYDIIYYSLSDAMKRLESYDIKENSVEVETENEEAAEVVEGVESADSSDSAEGVIVQENSAELSISEAGSIEYVQEDIQANNEEVEEEENKGRIREDNIEALKKYGVRIRPYLQDFTASWLGKGNYLTYGEEEVREQIQASYDLGIEDFCLWDPSNKYCFSALKLVEQEQ